MTPLAAWALSVMVGLAASSPYRATFDATAEGLVEAAQAAPLFTGDQGVEQTIAVELAIAFRESGFKVDATGDCNGLPAGSPLCPRARAMSLGLFQISRFNAPWLGVTADDLVGPPKTQATLALVMIRRSFQICVNKPLEERLGWYAVGGEGCKDSGAGRARMRLAKSILVRWASPSSVAPTDVSPSPKGD